MKKEAVIDVVDVEGTIYQAPLALLETGIDQTIAEILHLPKKKASLKKWRQMVSDLLTSDKSVTVGVVGKYLEHQDAYKSVFEAMIHGGIANKSMVKIKCIESDKFESEEEFALLASDCDGILVPGGFGIRGWEGKIHAAKYCRTSKMPYFGICMGMQVLAVEFARNVLNLPEAKLNGS